MTIAQKIKQKALELGFDLVGITTAEPLSDAQAEIFKRWLESGYAGQLAYMHKNLDKRINPAKLLDNAKSVICVALNYKTAHPSTPAPVATYARYEDYHPFIKNRLYRLADYIKSICTDFRFKVCVDSVPLAERPFATRAGLGFIGKNHLLINPALGPFLLLGELITTLELTPDKPIQNNCSACDKCIKACPTGVLRCDGFFDANRCISYLTIEYSGQIAPAIASKIPPSLFGCDRCILACPYADKAPPCQNKDFKFYPGRNELNLSRLLDMNDAAFQVEFADSPLLRAGVDKIKKIARLS